jgi:hypothetical protein
MPKIGVLVRIESKAEYADRGWLVRGQAQQSTSRLPGRD